MLTFGRSENESEDLNNCYKEQNDGKCKLVTNFEELFGNEGDALERRLDGFWR